MFDCLDFSRYSLTESGKFTDGTKLLKAYRHKKYKAIKQFAVSKLVWIGLTSTRN